MRPWASISHQRWCWAVELPDGHRIVGMTPTDVLERWGRVLGWLGAPATTECLFCRGTSWVDGEACRCTAPRPLTPHEVRSHIVRFVEATTEKEIPNEGLSDEDFLCRLDETGTIDLMRK